MTEESAAVWDACVLDPAFLSAAGDVSWMELSTEALAELDRRAKRRTPARAPLGFGPSIADSNRRRAQT